MVTSTPARNHPACRRFEKSSTDSPAPSRTTALVRGARPANVPRAYGPSGTRRAAMARLVAANGAFGGSRSRVTMSTAFQKPL